MVCLAVPLVYKIHLLRLLCVFVAKKPMVRFRCALLFQKEWRLVYKIHLLRLLCVLVAKKPVVRFRCALLFQKE
jgi:uncharacterized membrane protein AbrB (regulator of aidB expression)